MSSPALPHPDVVIVGAGVIGLAIALELRHRGAQVVVIERDTAMSHASTAAAGMLAASDPHNPPQLQPLSDLSISAYDEFLAHVQENSGVAVPYQTEITNQYATDGSSARLPERSLDPRQLAPALVAAAKNLGIAIREHTSVDSFPLGAQIVHTTGAWSRFGVLPRKGQMLRVQLPSNTSLTEVHRAEHVYVVPRTSGPQAGTALIGATVEDAAFDLTTHDEDLQRLRIAASQLSTKLGFLADAPLVEAWAGTRPSTRDGLPIIGQLDSGEFTATGHFRNGILLAPATARIIADLIQGRSPAIDVAHFRPDRFG